MKLERVFADCLTSRSDPHLGHTPILASAVTASLMALPRSSLCSMSPVSRPASSSRECATTSSWVFLPSLTLVMSPSSSLVMSGVVMCSAYSWSASMIAMPSWLGSMGSFLRYLTS